MFIKQHVYTDTPEIAIHKKGDWSGNTLPLPKRRRSLILVETISQYAIPGYFNLEYLCGYVGIPVRQSERPWNTLLTCEIP